MELAGLLLQQGETKKAHEVLTVVVGFAPEQDAALFHDGKADRPKGEHIGGMAMQPNPAEMVCCGFDPIATCAT